MLEFEKHGYFETLLDAETQKVVGNRTAKLRPGRKVGYEGKERITVIGDLPLSADTKRSWSGVTPGAISSRSSTRSAGE